MIYFILKFSLANQIFMFFDGLLSVYLRKNQLRLCFVLLGFSCKAYQINRLRCSRAELHVGWFEQTLNTGSACVAFGCFQLFTNFSPKKSCQTFDCICYGCIKKEKGGKPFNVPLFRYRNQRRFDNGKCTCNIPTTVHALIGHTVSNKKQTTNVQFIEIDCPSVNSLNSSILILHSLPVE